MDVRNKGKSIDLLSLWRWRAGVLRYVRRGSGWGMGIVEKRDLVVVIFINMLVCFG